MLYSAAANEWDVAAAADTIEFRAPARISRREAVDYIYYSNSYPLAPSSGRPSPFLSSSFPYLASLRLIE